MYGSFEFQVHRSQIKHGNEGKILKSLNFLMLTSLSFRCIKLKLILKQEHLVEVSRIKFRRDISNNL
jgi:hypothetical protein